MSNDYGFLVKNAKGDALESSDGVFKLLYVVDLPWVNGGLWHPKTNNKYPWSGNSSYPYMCVRIFDETETKIDYEKYRNDFSLKGEFVHLVESKNILEKQKSFIIKTGLRALAGKSLNQENLICL